MNEVQVMVCLERCASSRAAGLRVVGLCEPLIPHHQLSQFVRACVRLCLKPLRFICTLHGRLQQYGGLSTPRG